MAGMRGDDGQSRPCDSVAARPHGGPGRHRSLLVSCVRGAIVVQQLGDSVMTRGEAPRLIMRGWFARLKLLWMTRAQRAAFRRLFRSRRS
jgi:hypothetical protein